MGIKQIEDVKVLKSILDAKEKNEEETNTITIDTKSSSLSNNANDSRVYKTIKMNAYIDGPDVVLREDIVNNNPDYIGTQFKIPKRDIIKILQSIYRGE